MTPRNQELIETIILAILTCLVIWLFICIKARTQPAIIQTVSAQDDKTLVQDNKTPQNAFTEEIRGNVSAYSSSEDETDATPFITANGKQVYDGLIANNCLEYGTEVAIQEDKIGDVEFYKIYTINDRMNSRYGCEHFDIWMKSKQGAINFGRKKLIIHR